MPGECAPKSPDSWIVAVRAKWRRPELSPSRASGTRDGGIPSPMRSPQLRLARGEAGVRVLGTSRGIGRGSRPSSSRSGQRAFGRKLGKCSRELHWHRDRFSFVDWHSLFSQVSSCLFSQIRGQKKVLYAGRGSFTPSIAKIPFAISRNTSTSF